MRVGQTGRGRALAGERPMSAAAYATYGGNGVRGKDRGKWRQANRPRQLQTAIRPGVMPSAHVCTRRGSACPVPHAQTGTNLTSLFLLTHGRCTMGLTTYTAGDIVGAELLAEGVRRCVHRGRCGGHGGSSPHPCGRGGWGHPSFGYGREIDRQHGIFSGGSRFVCAANPLLNPQGETCSPQTARPTAHIPLHHSTANADR